MSFRTEQKIAGALIKPMIAMIVVGASVGLVSLGSGSFGSSSRSPAFELSNAHLNGKAKGVAKNPATGATTTVSTTSGATKTVSLHNAGTTNGVPNSCSLASEGGSSAPDWLFILNGLPTGDTVPGFVTITWQYDNGSGTYTSQVGLSSLDGQSGHYLVYEPGAAPISGTAVVSSSWSGEFVISGGPGCASTPSLDGSPGLSLVEMEAPGSPNPITTVGQSITYDFVVTDTGNTTLSNLTVIDDQSVAGESLAGPVSCPVMSLAAGASVTCTGTYTVTSTDISNGKVTDVATAKAQTSTGTSITSAPATLTITVATTNASSTNTSSPTTKSSSTNASSTNTSSPTTKSSSTNASSTNTSSPTTKSSSTAPAPVKLVTGPPNAPANTTNALPIGIGIASLGIAGLAYVGIERKRKGTIDYGKTDEVA